MSVSAAKTRDAGNVVIASAEVIAFGEAVIETLRFGHSVFHERMTVEDRELVKEIARNVAYQYFIRRRVYLLDLEAG